MTRVKAVRGVPLEDGQEGLFQFSFIAYFLSLEQSYMVQQMPKGTKPAPVRVGRL